MLQIRFAEKSDINQLVALCEAHAKYEKASYKTAGKASQLERDLFATQPKLYCLVAASGGVLSGYATYMKQYATWDAGEYIYMDCLFMKANARGQRIGTMLMDRIKLEAQHLGCDLIQWQTPEFNAGAIKFYNRLGATSKSKERFFWKV